MGLKTSALAAVALASVLAATPAPASAADLGGNCCADLEERIAELEATAARKGNRKMSLRVYGTINKAITHLSGDGFDGDWNIGENSNVESFIGVAGEAVITPHWKAGYVLEIGVGGYDDVAGSALGGDTNGIYTRRSYGYLKSDQLGTLNLGLTNQATDGIAEISVANTRVAARMLSLRPLVGPQIGDALDIYDGTRGNIVRYDSPVMAGARLSASWASGGFDAGWFGHVETDDVWDVALTWAGRNDVWAAAAGVGYRKGAIVPTVGNIGAFGWGPNDFIDPEVISGSASIKHIPTGLFVNGAIGQFDPGGLVGKYTGKITSWTAQGGLENKWFELGETTLYGEYADSDDLNLKYWGGGVVQHLDNAAADLYATVRRYEVDGNATLFMAGVRIDF